MPRTPRILAPELPCHVTARGNNRAPIFFDDADRQRFIGLLSGVLARDGWTCHAYCLMDNHYHLVIEAPGSTLSTGMRWLNSRYAQRFNHRHSRSGHLFQGRYHARPVEEEAHFLELCRYVVLNPVRAGLCSDPGEWPWSSYRGAVGTVRDPLTSRSHVPALFGTGSRGKRAYRNFVLGGLGIDAPCAATPGHHETVSCDPGDSDERLSIEDGAGEITSLATILATERNPLTTAHHRHGYSLREIAKHLGCHETTAGRKMRRERRALDSTD